MRKQLFLSFFFISLVYGFYPPVLQAQSSCDKALITAENLYQSGQLYDVAEVLLPCLEKGFNFQEKQSAYRLLTLTYLNINQEENAKNTLHKLLKLNPDYLISPEKDPIELVNLYQQFNVEPILYVGLRGGASLSRPFILHSRSSSSLSEDPDKSYKPFYGFNLGGDFALPLFKRLLLEFHPSYGASNYLFHSLYLTDGFNTTSQPQVQEVNGRESYHHIHLPFSLNLRIRRDNSRLYYNIAAGAGATFLISSSYRDVNRVNRQIFTEEINMSRIGTTPYRRKANLQVHAELGLEYKYLGYFWGARGGMSSTLYNFTQYPSQQEMFLNTMSTTFGWLDDDFVLARGYFLVFVRKPLYKFL